MFTRSVTLCERRTQTLNVINFSRGSVEKMKGFEGVALFSLIFFLFFEQFHFPFIHNSTQKEGVLNLQQQNYGLHSSSVPYRSQFKSHLLQGWMDGRTDGRMTKKTATTGA